jgi:tetratricopeptide (TPR) repeat protein
MEPTKLDPAELRRWFLRAVDLGPDERATLLSDPSLSTEMREELEAMLHSVAGAETFFNGIVSGAQPPCPGLGERFGPFETRQLIGRGGMGSVFKAERVDGELSQTVALKVIERGWWDPHAIERFRQERQFLAGLVHPNIARLIDGGTRSDGVPYLAMEFVDGERLDQFCIKHRLSIPERLLLFLPICEAVDCAHQQLIIHRDLKPSNVLVDRSGQPKLLDFGIAKALDSNTGERTQTLLLTPDFASPEQALGQQATTATDTYGLGAVLYSMLTGSALRSTRGMSGAEIQHAIRDQPPARPSSLHPELKGDLENILTKALHVDPQRRYRSARELSDDIQRYLSHRPVLATPDSVAYRARRFIRRNTIVTAAAALAFLAAAVGTGASLYQAHRARQRFEQVRELANHFVFDFEAAIRDTPGTLAARRMVASTAREYLASLAADAGSDRQLKRELSESYYRLSRVEMSAGESQASMDHLRKSIDILKALNDGCCGPPRQRSQYILGLADLARYEDDSRSQEEARRLSAEAVGAARAWLAEAPQEALGRRTLASALSTEGNVLVTLGDARHAREDLEEAVHLADQLYQESQQDEELGFSRARAGHWLASTLSALGDYAAARDQEEQAKSILDRLLARHQENFRWRQLRVQMATSSAGIFRHLAQTDPSTRTRIMEAVREAYEMARLNSQRSPEDKDLLDTRFVMTSRMASQLVRDNREAESVGLFEEAGALVEELLKHDPADFRNLYLLANNYNARGRVYLDLNQPDKADPLLGQAEQIIQPVLARRSGDLAVLNLKFNVLLNQAIAARRLGKTERARGRCSSAMGVALDLVARNKDAKNPIDPEDLKELHREARLLGVPEATAVADRADAVH